MKWILAACLLITSSRAATITWSNKGSPSTRPGYIGYTDIQYDPVSHCSLVFAAPLGSSTIYFSSLWAWCNAATSGAWTHVIPNGGTETTSDTCTADAPTVPGERHYSMLATIDTARSLIWGEGGVNVQCSGSAPNTNPRQDIYYRTLTSDPTNGVWTKAASTHYPLNSSYGPFRYDSDHDLFFSFGTDAGAQTHDNWIYCSTVPNGGGSPSGTLSAAQIRGGCTVADDFVQLTMAGLPTAVQFTNMVYVPGSVFGGNNGRFILYGGLNSGGTTCYNLTWSANMEAATWTQVAQSTTPPPIDTSDGTGSGTPADNCQPPIAYDSVAHLIRYHRNNDGSDYHYDPAADTWTQDTSSGTTFAPAAGGTTRGTILTFDTSCNCLVAWNQNAGSGNAEIWQGQITSGSSLSGSLSISGGATLK